jgi:transcriptional regulator with XRE-family HTH domain
MESSNIGRRIRAAEAFGGFAGRRELAEAIESSPSTLQRIESGARTAKRAELLAIAEACEVPVWFLERGWDGWRDAGAPKDVDAIGRRAVEDIEGGRGARRAAGD